MNEDCPRELPPERPTPIEELIEILASREFWEVVFGDDRPPHT